MAGPVEGLNVVELGVWVAGPAASGILADWGADVIKIEPPAGDPGRMFGRMLGCDLGVNPPFELDNRSKRSIVLDLTTDDGRKTASRRRLPTPKTGRWPEALLRYSDAKGRCFDFVNRTQSVNPNRCPSTPFR